MAKKKKVVKLRTQKCAYDCCDRQIPCVYGGPGVSLSRQDSKTLICSYHGTQEAFDYTLPRGKFNPKLVLPTVVLPKHPGVVK